MKPRKYNWKGSGPSGCDSHCVSHPCGVCITGKPNKASYERDLYAEQLTTIETLLEYIEAVFRSRSDDNETIPIETMRHILKLVQKVRGVS